MHDVSGLQMARGRITSKLRLEMIQVAPDLLEEGQVWLIPEIEAR